LTTHGQRVLQLLRRDVGLAGDADDQSHHFAPAERHQRQLADLRLLCGVAMPAVVENRIQRRIERNLKDAGGKGPTWILSQ
jgi:hypothetical protein